MATFLIKDKIHFPSESEIAQIADYQEVANRNLSLAIKRLYKMQRWTAKALNKRIPGISIDYWQNLGRATFDRNRQLHVLAALSWLTQTSMSAFYQGEDIQKHWPGVNMDVISCITFCSMLPVQQFEYLVYQMLSKVEYEGYKNQEKVESHLKQLRKYKDEEIFIPKILDINEFRYDYYHSVALSLREFRERYNLRTDQVAHVFNVTEGKYRSYESLTNPVTMPAHIGLRFKLGFKLENTVHFASKMKKFKGFYLSRTIQEVRDLIIIELMRNTSPKLRGQLLDFARKTMIFHQN